MSFGDIVETVILGDWCCGWVLVRRVLLLVLALPLSATLVRLILSYDNWKAAGMLHEPHHAFPTSGSP